MDPTADEEMWICSISHFKHKISIHFAERKANLIGNWAMQNIKLQILFSEMYYQYLSD